MNRGSVRKFKGKIGGKKRFPKGVEVERVRGVKTICWMILGWMSVGGVEAVENRYDVVAKMIQPFGRVFSKEAKGGGERGMILGVKLERLTGLPAELVGSRAELVLEYPDKVRMRAPVMGEELVVCRNGEKVWVWPGSRAKEILGKAGKLPVAEKGAKLGNFGLPGGEKQLGFLAMLFRIEDVGVEKLDGEGCRVMDLFLMPELAKGLKEKDWAARIWVKGDGMPGRFSLVRGGWQMVVRFERVEFSKGFPKGTWEPSEAESADILWLDAGGYGQLLGAFWK
jgi:hypothetical protein